MASYGQVLYQRAVGEAPEMESGKAAAHLLRGVLRSGDHLLDVGCGAGHYLRTLRREFSFPFGYTGVDATVGYIALAKKAFVHDEDAAFLVGDIEKLPADDRSADIVLCCNVLLHLPRIAPAMQELWRVTRRTLLIRTLVGETSFRIKQVREWEGMHTPEDSLFDEEGEPHRFHYFNIYSERYMRWLCERLTNVSRCSIEPDLDFDLAALTESQWPEQSKPPDLTRTIGGMQRNGSILEPWAFIRLDRN
jgi:ubiquinone/menaquinone biosynthesis C-methylase UbiE